MRGLYDTCVLDGNEIRCENEHDYHLAWAVTNENPYDDAYTLKFREITEKRLDFVTFDQVFADLLSPYELALLHVLRVCVIAPNRPMRLEVGRLEVVTMGWVTLDPGRPGYTVSVMEVRWL